MNFLKNLINPLFSKFTSKQEEKEEYDIKKTSIFIKESKFLEKNLKDPQQFILLKDTIVQTANNVKFQLQNKSSTKTYDSEISFFKNGVFHFYVNSQTKPINFFPPQVIDEAKTINSDSLEIMLDNSIFFNTDIFKLGEETKKFLIRNFLSSEEDWNRVSLKLNFDPFSIDYSIVRDKTVFKNSKKYETLEKIKLMSLTITALDELTSVQTTHFETFECYGLPERMCRLNLSDGDYRLFNSDRPDHHPDDHIELYGTVPLLYNKHNNIMSAILVDNPSEAKVSIKSDLNQKSKTVSWSFDNGSLSTYFYSDELNKIFFKNCSISGFPNLAPLFALGYHQCRYGYDSLEDAFDVYKKFTEYKLPFDVFWFDIDHTDRKHYFTWNKDFKPELLDSLISDLEKSNKKLVTIIDPHLSTDKDYFVSNELLKEKCLILKSDKTEFKGSCWPGESYYGDYLNPKTQEVYSNILYKNEEYFKNSKNIFTWCDMNEPSVFDGPEKTFPKDNLAFDGKDYYKAEQFHNIYGQSYHKTCFTALLNRYPNKRAFTLTRSTYTGSQQWGFHWTGDNTSNWGNCKYSLEMLMTLSYCGINNAGADLGGFLGNPSEDLLTFWYQVASFTNFYRGHSDIESKRREPWRYGEKVMSKVRNSINLRYNLLLFFYGCNFVSSQTGKPLINPYRNTQHLYLIGDTFVLPIMDKKDTPVPFDFLKTNELYNFSSKKLLVNDTLLNMTDMKLGLNVLIRGGRIIPFISNSKLNSYNNIYDKDAEYEIQVFLDVKESAKGYFYLDDGSSFDFKNGDYILAEFTYESGVFKYNVINKPKDELEFVKKSFSKIEIFKGNTSLSQTIDKKITESFQL